MNTGWFWFDDDKKRTLFEKVIIGAAYYQKKYGQAATVCYVNPSVLVGYEEPVQVNGIRLLKSKTIIVNHFWFQAEEK